MIQLKTPILLQGYLSNSKEPRKKYFSVIFFLFRDIEKIRNGIAERVSHFICLMVGFVVCVTLSFVYGWKLTLVVIGYVPIICITNMIISRVRYIFLK